MTDEEGPVVSVFGWCAAAPGTRPDQYHYLCRRHYRSPFGVEHVCGCAEHANEKDAD
jgi:hypothetical protein